MSQKPTYLILNYSERYLPVRLCNNRLWGRP